MREQQRSDTPPEDPEPEEGDRVIELRNGKPVIYTQPPKRDKNAKKIS
jgi:hypothetical protein